MNTKYFRKNAIIFLDLLGMINSTFLGFYIFFTIQTLPLLNTEFQAQGYIGSGIAAVCAFLLIFGIHFVWKERFYKSGAINLASGITLLCLFIYFAYLTEIQILKWLEPIGLFLAVPQVLSGLIAVMPKASS
jgi:hypothetical protein